MATRRRQPATPQPAPSAEDVLQQIAAMPALQQMLAQYNEAQVAYVKASIRLLEGLGYTVTGPGQ